MDDSIEEFLESAVFWDAQASKAEKVGRAYEAKDYRIRSNTYLARASQLEALAAAPKDQQP